MKNIFVIGNIGSGKSAFVTLLSQALNQCNKNVNVLDLDKIGHEVLSDNNVKNLLLTKLGNFSNRQDLALIVFKDKQKLNELNNIVRPYIYKKMLNLLEIAKKDNFEYTIIEQSVYTGHNDIFAKNADYLISVVADFDIRMSRCLKRDMTKNDFEARNNVQIDTKIFLKNADCVITNNEGKGALAVQAKDLAKVL